MDAVLPLKVLLIAAAVPRLERPPPDAAAFRLSVLPAICNQAPCKLATPPPVVAWLSAIVLSISSSDVRFTKPPPVAARWPAPVLRSRQPFPATQTPPPSPPAVFPPITL